MEPNAQLRQQTVNDYETIDLLELARVIWSKIWFVAIGFVLGAAIVFSVCKFVIRPQYQATSTIYIFSKTTSITSIADINLGNSLTGDFTYIATTRDVIESVISELGLTTTYGDLSKRVRVTNPSNTHMLVVSAEDYDPVTAANISNALSENLREQIADIMNTDKPSIVQRAVVPTAQSKPNVNRNTAIGALLGALLVAGIIVVRYLLDDTIKSNEDVRKYLELDTLAELPYIKSWEDKRKKSSGGSDRKSQKSMRRAG